MPMQPRRSKRIADLARARHQAMQAHSPQHVILKQPTKRPHRPRPIHGELVQANGHTSRTLIPQNYTECMFDPPKLALFQSRSKPQSRQLDHRQSLKVSQPHERQFHAFPQPSFHPLANTRAPQFRHAAKLQWSQEKQETSATDESSSSLYQQHLPPNKLKRPLTTSRRPSPAPGTSHPSVYTTRGSLTNAMNLSRDYYDIPRSSGIDWPDEEMRDRYEDKRTSSALSPSLIIPHTNPLPLSTDSCAGASATISQTSEYIGTDAPTSRVKKSTLTPQPPSSKRVFATPGCLEDSTSFLSEPLPVIPGRSVACRLHIAFQQVWSSTCKLIKTLFVTAPDYPVTRSVTSWSVHHS